MSNYNPFTLKDKTILITGASSGIGKATAIECSRLGANCIISGRNEERLNETFSLLEGEGHSQIIADLSNPASVDLIVEQVPVLNGLVNNAGGVLTLPVNFITEEKIEKIIQVNEKAPVLLFAKLLKKKKLAKNSSVVFTSSIGGPLIGGSFGNSLYAITKGGISAFVRAGALELAKKQIRVNAVCPGMINTNIYGEKIITQEQLEEDAKTYPLGRYGRPEEVAWAIIYLISDAASFVTGSNLVIDGGISIQ